MKNNEGLTAHSLAFNNNHVRIVTLIDNALNLMQEEEGEGVTKVTNDPPPHDRGLRVSELW